MNKSLKKLFNKFFKTEEYLKEVNGYYKLDDDLREKLEYSEKYISNEEFDKFFSWQEFKEIASVVQCLFTFNLGHYEISIYYDGKEYAYWIEYFSQRIEEKVSDNAFELLESICIEGKPMSEIWGNFE